MTTTKQLMVVVLMFLIMAGGVAWMSFGLVKAVPLLLGVYEVASLLRRRADFLRRAKSSQLSESELESIRDLTIQLQSRVKGEAASACVSRELELVHLAKLAAASGDWNRAYTYLTELRRT